MPGKKEPPRRGGGGARDGGGSHNGSTWKNQSASRHPHSSAAGVNSALALRQLHCPRPPKAWRSAIDALPRHQVRDSPPDGAATRGTGTARSCAWPVSPPHPTSYAQLGWCRAERIFRRTDFCIPYAAGPCENTCKTTENDGNSTCCCSDKGVVHMHRQKTQAAEQCIIEAQTVMRVWRCINATCSRGEQEVAGQ